MLHPTAWYATRLTDAPHDAPSIRPQRASAAHASLPPSLRRCQWLAALLPAGFAAPIAIIQNFRTYAVFYTPSPAPSMGPSRSSRRSSSGALRTSSPRCPRRRSTTRYLLECSAPSRDAARAATASLTARRPRSLAQVLPAVWARRQRRPRLLRPVRALRLRPPPHVGGGGLHLRPVGRLLEVPDGRRGGLGLGGAQASPARPPRSTADHLSHRRFPLALLTAPSDALSPQVLGINHYLTTRVLTDPECVDQTAQKKAKTKTKMGIEGVGAVPRVVQVHPPPRHGWEPAGHAPRATSSHRSSLSNPGTSACWPRW